MPCLAKGQSATLRFAQSVFFAAAYTPPQKRISFYSRPNEPRTLRSPLKVASPFPYGDHQSEQSKSV